MVVQEGFALWSEVYDQQVNPLLSLEERFLSEVLPKVRGLDVLDVGCGTGRWLARFAPQSPASLTGIDSSAQMVARARRKLGSSATVLLGRAESLPLPHSSVDLLLASFVASYVPELSRLAAEARRAVRPGAEAYLSDLHPATAAACKWKRGFRAAGTEVELSIHARSIEEVISCFEAVGFEAVSLLEVRFGSPEQEILRSAGKSAVFHAAADRPAIYILQLRIADRRRKSHATDHNAQVSLGLTGARVVVGPGESAYSGITIADGEIATIGCAAYRHCQPDAGAAASLDLSGYLLLPGLTNSHDHLEFGLFPNLGRGPYANFEQWAQDIHQTEKDVIARQRLVPKHVRLWWGAIRNLLCGVTTVCHHNPLCSELLADNFPVRVVKRFGWAHSLALDCRLSGKFDATPKGTPFVLHVAEGLDQKSAQEIFELDKMRLLDERTVLVHGLGLSPDGLSLLKERGAALVWCPTSNCFLFGRTHDRKSLSLAGNVVLGSDSPLTSTGDLLDDIRYAHFEKLVSEEELFRMVITRPPVIFRLADGRGTIRPGAVADLIAVRDTGQSPASRLARMSSRDVELVLIGGRVQIASQVLFDRLPTKLTSGLYPLEVAGEVRWIRAPLCRLFNQASQVLGRNIVLANKKVRHVCTG
jgi:cytosine/adenosine deaminase-related metal-dependent hydrolase/ubiquinone/menaquinone biosynthesis C-methylase UbiE